jgi:hypothetical protein
MRRASRFVAAGCPSNALWMPAVRRLSPSATWPPPKPSSAKPQDTRTGAAHDFRADTRASHMPDASSATIAARPPRPPPCGVAERVRRLRDGVRQAPCAQVPGRLAGLGRRAGRPKARSVTSESSRSNDMNRTVSARLGDFDENQTSFSIYLLQPARISAKSDRLCRTAATSRR